MSDEINPGHYRGFSNGAQVIDIVERLNFNRGNAIKYIARAGRKEGAATITDLEKARWYLDREIERIRADGKEAPPQTPPIAGVGAPIAGVLGGPNPVALGATDTSSKGA